MAGIYIHVPFCKSRCIYCDFFSTTEGTEVQEKYVRALVKEMELRRDEARGAQIETLYLGGGTPSLLSYGTLEHIFAALHRYYDITPEAEITLEANPDDVSAQAASFWRQLGINRTSLGVQTFHDATLRFLHRRHDGTTAIKAVETLAAAGMDNISIDLIYALPGQTLDLLKADLDCASSLPVSHISTYCLTYEADTPLTKLKQEQRVEELNDETSRMLYYTCKDRLEECGFKQYELSNFALRGHVSRHNSAYWTRQPYIGFGPGAHSFDGTRRRSNRTNLVAYCNSAGSAPHDIETLNEDERYNEAVFLALRTRKGLSLKTVSNEFGSQRRNYLQNAAKGSLKAKLLRLEGDCLSITRRGLFVADNVMSNLMYI